MGGMILVSVLLVGVALLVASLALMAILQLEQEQRIAARNLVPVGEVARPRARRHVRPAASPSVPSPRGRTAARLRPVTPPVHPSTPER